MAKHIHAKLKELVSEESKTINTKIEITDSGELFIKPQGYGDYCSADGYGTPIIVEIVEGVLRVCIWSDINQEDPTHIVSLEKARESLREELI